MFAIAPGGEMAIVKEDRDLQFPSSLPVLIG